MIRSIYWIVRVFVVAMVAVTFIRIFVTYSGVGPILYQMGQNAKANLSNVFDCGCDDDTQVYIQYP
jgi:hypothetical protein